MGVRVIPFDDVSSPSHTTALYVMGHVAVSAARLRYVCMAMLDKMDGRSTLDMMSEGADIYEYGDPLAVLDARLRILTTVGSSELPELRTFSARIGAARQIVDDFNHGVLDFTGCIRRVTDLDVCVVEFNDLPDLVNAVAGITEAWTAATQYLYGNKAEVFETWLAKC